MLVKAILVHGEIGYKFFLLLPSEDRNQGHQLIDHQSTGHTPVGHENQMAPCWGPLKGHESADTPIGNESNGVVAGNGATLQWYHIFRVIVIFITSLVIFLSSY